jgi:L-asparaginase / beta-aspartyl-peptidase
MAALFCPARHGPAVAKAVITGTRNAEEGLEVGRRILAGGGSALDAVEAAIRVTEDDPLDWSVGFDGLPNLLGKVELDASIMVGSTRRAGAVAGVRTMKNPITLARKVMEETPHLLLVGEGADRFARAMGFPKEELQSAEGRKRYANIMAGRQMLEGMGKVPDSMAKLAWRYEANLKRQLEEFDVRAWYERLSRGWHGTVDVIAIDRKGEVCSGVSTSGLALKFPGRAGDSPLIGAGNYADARYGAAACVGQGELAIRFSAARTAVLHLRAGKTPRQAASAVLREVLREEPRGILQILVVSKTGEAAASASQEGLHTVYWREGMEAVERRPSNLLRKG